MSFIRTILSILVVGAFHFVGIVGLYWLFPWYDAVVHFLGGFAMGVLALDAWRAFGITAHAQKPWVRTWVLQLAMVIGFVSFIGILWELHEFVLDAVRGVVRGVAIARQPSIADTMADFVMDISGGLVAYGFWKTKS